MAALPLPSATIPFNQRQAGTGALPLPSATIPFGQGQAGTATFPLPLGHYPFRSGTGWDGYAPAPFGHYPFQSGTGWKGCAPAPFGHYPFRSGAGWNGCAPAPFGHYPFRSGIRVRARIPIRERSRRFFRLFSQGKLDFCGSSRFFPLILRKVCLYSVTREKIEGFSGYFTAVRLFLIERDNGQKISVAPFS